MKRFSLFLITSFFVISAPVTFATTAVENAYNQFLANLEIRYDANTQTIILEDLNNKLEDISETTSKKSLLPVINSLQQFNNEQLYTLWLARETGSAQQRISELREIAVLEKNLENTQIPSYISNLLWPNISYIRTDKARQFIDWNTIKRVIYSSYIPLSQSSASRLASRKGIIIYDESSWYRFIEDYSFETKTPYSELQWKFWIFLTENHRISQRNGSIYAYNFLNFRYFQDVYWVYESDLETSWFDYDTTLLYKRADGWYNFVTDYSEYEIASSNILFWVPEKHLFLEYLREDVQFETSDINAHLANMKSVAKSLTQWKTREQAISSIYSWVLDNVEYSKVIDLEDQKIFSGLETFKNNEGVCTWYTKLSSYLFYFAWYHDVEVIKGHVIDAQDFPQIWHAWLKIWDLYYDPTFDDPIWAELTKQADQYKYFWLPKDIFYANRYEYGDLPEFLNTASDSEIREHIFAKLSKLIPKYRNSLSDYPVFWPVVFRQTYNLSPQTQITPTILAAKIWTFTVENNSFRYTDNSGAQKQIIGFRYYPLTNENTSSVLDFLSYDINNLTLFNWQKESWEYEWRLAYELETR